MRQIVEMEPMLLLAVVEGLFGVTADFGRNLLCVRPNFPGEWAHAEVETGDFRLRYRRETATIELQVTMPVQRRVRVEIPVKAPVTNVSVDGKAVPYTLEKAVNACRVIVACDEADCFNIKVELQNAVDRNRLIVRGPSTVLVGEPTRYEVQGASVIDVHDPQGRLSHVSHTGRRKETVLTSEKRGRWTVFLELEAGESRWLQPLDLDVRSPWELRREYISAYNPGGPSVSQPGIDTLNRVLKVGIVNNDAKSLQGPAEVTVAGQIHRLDLDIPAGSTSDYRLNIAKAWSRLTPGRVPIQVRLHNQVECADAVSWNNVDGDHEGSVRIADRVSEIDLSPHFNISIRRLYGKQFSWRHDYTGGQYGVDVRDPPPLRDHKGYVVMTQPVAQFEYQSIETNTRIWNAAYEVPDLPPEIRTPFGVSFRTGVYAMPNGEYANMLALASTEPFEQLPSAAVITLPRPMPAEKIYLLTLNLTKTVKCYYPGAEVVLGYDDGSKHTVELVPPYSMSCFAQHFSPFAFAIPFGRIEGGDLLTPLRFGDPVNREHLAVSDVVVDSKRLLSSVELRCVASETVFGIVALSVLTAL